MKIDDTQRLDFLLNHTIEWLNTTKNGKDTYEIQIYDGGDCKGFLGDSSRDCIDKAIIEERNENK